MRGRNGKRCYPFWRPWYTRMKDFILRHFIECPACKGEGGETEVILDDGTGPYYPCGYCKETGRVLNPIKRFQWWWWEHRIF